MGQMPQLDAYQLSERYSRERGRVFLTGTQAIVRIALDQIRRDRAAGLNTAGFISGYRGSPLGGVDLELWKIGERLKESRIEFLPAVNEDLAATAVLGSQQVETQRDRKVDGVFGLWYGKGPGVDRSGDALKHGNAYGSSPHGGVLVAAGDDHGCVSSSMPHQSDVAFMSWFMPTLHPADVGEYLAFGEYGYALSRFSGMWVGFKAISEIVESGASVELAPPRIFAQPDFVPPPGGLHYRWPDLPGPQIEERLEAKKHAVYAFAKANPIDRRIYDIKDATYGIVTTGKAHLDLMEALRLIRLDEAACRRFGIDIYKVGMVWPLALHDAMEFVKGKREILVVEEKRGIIESQFKEYFYDYPGSKPERMVGKHDETGARLISWTGELSPLMLADVLARRLDPMFPELQLARCVAALRPEQDRMIVVPGATRTPYFCSGCPHNTSTKVPEGSKALAGIGCHFMASWMDRETSSLIQMGGEGVNWAASSRFTGNSHVFQNLGEGTYYHSGSMAIRQAIAAKANITYKILFNDAVAMTGGQPVDGPVSVQAIAHSVRAEGVARIALVSDDPAQFSPTDLPAGVTIHPREEMDAVQRELRTISGVTVLIYQQTCATEKRRRRKRGTIKDPARFAYINDLVCEGCGDCSVESNCLSVEPKETPFGRKRKINLSTCNKDFSCLNGFCPSFVTIEGGTRRAKGASAIDPLARAAALPAPELAALDKPYDLLVTGVGGTGVITVGALIAMAAHLEGRGVSVLDFTGFAQKFGPVLSYLRLAAAPEALHQVRIDQGAADALIGCDLVVSSSAKASGTYRKGMRAAVNIAEMPTGDVVRFRDADLASPVRLRAIERVIGSGNLTAIDANALAERLLGDSVYANVMMLGFAWQQGLVPVSLDALTRAIELNGVAVERNKQALAWGRIAFADPEFLKADGAAANAPETLEQMIARRADFLRDYQDEAYAARYRTTVDRVRRAEAALGSETLTDAVARSLFKLMAYKDEYEVARLHMQTGFLETLKHEFDGDFTVQYHLAPPLLPARLDARGRPRKRAFGQWIQTPLRLLARLKGLRGTPFDVFGYTAERLAERELIGWYEALIETMLGKLDATHLPDLVALAKAPMEIRGYGPVKDEAIEKTKAEVARLTALLTSAPSDSGDGSGRRAALGG
ncbi:MULTISPECIES: indolepyruvate ferredoxin oxidoreductase family protein [unclassified Bradyrhizobium]|uniref:indolepyruvate ferredoxin oxidoreductase family protein n=1 Tax=unclassified Bradyrhizobium TaxID=2631580 RepID=UPI001BAAFED6|nr:MULTISPECIES: indolepyruvate ferredoxin oxidoreductase family protein [unclassified Bradyrhizobium]MBR1203260.1 indolepyruvate ferredoxin oxidoreductase family protein [Bradyrhizobium sp. AUGA SZCCT0124]MBR1312923.1 indolepyruvate ferredoxin oxidoreductase family protein [Bradyrhizobium sp. AUGA SZCCT0051]MBR1341281.1 indolepyruvate ferredoxin oxidoreductase family protein [Bradyrhizobium sp. AUGA SZCCT0105]MBR1356781.1 indolepyruvate ferredoxin oxidoreductase family protein [Bradyrhizobium 